MRSKSLIYATAVLAVAMLANLSVTPALAKPYQVTIVLKDQDNKPINGMWVTLTVHKASGPDEYPSAPTDKGKAVFSLTPGVDYVSFDVSIGPPPRVILETGLTLSKQYSARVTLQYTP